MHPSSQPNNINLDIPFPNLQNFFDTTESFSFLIKLAEIQQHLCDKIAQLCEEKPKINNIQNSILLSSLR